MALTLAVVALVLSVAAIGGVAWLALRGGLERRALWKLDLDVIALEQALQHLSELHHKSQRQKNAAKATEARVEGAQRDSTLSQEAEAILAQAGSPREPLSAENVLPIVVDKDELRRRARMKP